MCRQLGEHIDFLMYDFDQQFQGMSWNFGLEHGSFRFFQRYR